MEWLNKLDKRLERHDSDDEGQSSVNIDQVVVSKPIHVAFSEKQTGDDSIGARAFDRIAPTRRRGRWEITKKETDRLFER